MTDIERLKQLAGINKFKGYVNYSPDTALDGSNCSLTGTEKRQIERTQNIKPGTKEWFKLWFSKPYLTGEKPV